MSLINDVLRDLERRGEREPTVTTPPAGPTPSGRRRAWIWWLAAAVLAGAALHWVTGRDAAPGPGDSALLAADGPADGDAGQARDDRGRVPTMLQPLPEVTAGDDGNHEASPAASKPLDPEASTTSAADPAVGSPGPDPAPHSADSPANAAAADAGGPTPPLAHRPADSGAGPAEGRKADTDGPRAGDADDEPAIVIQRSGQPETDTQAGYDGARRAMARGNPGLAAARLEEVLESRPDHVEARLMLARIHIGAGRPRAASKLLEAGLEQDPAASRLAYLWGRLLLQQGRVASALDVLEAYEPAREAYPDYHLLMAAALRQSGDHQAAAGAYRAIAKAQPGLGQAWVGLGVSLEETGRAGEAREAYTRALRGDDRRAADFARQRLAVLPEATKPESD